MKRRWHVEVEYLPAATEFVESHAEWFCETFERTQVGFLLLNTHMGQEQLLIPYGNVRSIAVSRTEGK